MPLVRHVPSPQVARLVDTLDRAFHGDAWHGPSILEALREVTARMACARPIPRAHTIWEIVLHVTSWKHEVCHRLEGAEPSMPREGDWPQPPREADAEWALAREKLETAHRRLLAVTRLLQDARLNDMVGAHRDAPLGTGVTFQAMLLGMAQHDVYHAAQIVLLKKAAGG